MKIGFGTIQGSTHRKLDYNNQDSVIVLDKEDHAIGIIADGCGGGSNSEVGAQLGVKFLAKTISEKIERKEDWQINLKEEIQTYSTQLSDLHEINSIEFIRNYLLYTLIGFVLKDNAITIFTYGDGAVIVDNQVDIIDQNNRPKYVNNKLIGAEEGKFEFREMEHTGQRILIGSDGVEDIISGIKTGRIEEYVSISEFMSDEENYVNPIKLPRLLQKYSLNGLIKDDCTLIMIK